MKKMCDDLTLETRDRITALLNLMDEEIMYRMNRGMILYETTVDDFETTERYFQRCAEWRKNRAESEAK